MTVAVVTGAARGLGLAVARELAARGVVVVLTGRDSGALERAAADLPGARAAVLDVASDASVAAFFTKLQLEEGRLDILVNNAGRIYGGRGDDLAGTDAPRMLEALDNNALGAWRMMQRALPLMGETGGCIVNVSSGMGAITSMGSDAVAYRASKALLNVFTRIAASSAPPGVKVNAVCPGWVRTEMGGPHATRSVAEGAAGILWAATLPDDGPTGASSVMAAPSRGDRTPVRRNGCTCQFSALALRWPRSGWAQQGETQRGSRPLRALVGRNSGYDERQAPGVGVELALTWSE